MPKNFDFYPNKMKYHMVLKHWFKFMRVIFVFFIALHHEFWLKNYLTLQNFSVVGEQYQCDKS